MAGGLATAGVSKIASVAGDLALSGVRTAGEAFVEGLSGGVTPSFATRQIGAIGELDRIRMNSAAAITGGITNPLPENGVFARVMPQEFAEAFARGEASIAPSDEAFITAADDLNEIYTVGAAQQRLSLFQDFQGTMPRTDGDALVLFKLSNYNAVTSPVEFANSPRGYGFVGHGLTGGGAREFILTSGVASEIGAYDIQVISLGR